MAVGPDVWTLGEWDPGVDASLSVALPMPGLHLRAPVRVPGRSHRPTD